MRLFLLPLIACSLAHAQPLVTNTFDTLDTLDKWSVKPSEGVTASIALDTDAKGLGGGPGHSLRLDYEFTKGAGYAILRLPLGIDLPPNYQLSYSIRGEGLPNNIETKLVDGAINGDKANPETDNVWWVNNRDVAFPSKDVWQHISLKRRQFAFAWGPSGGNTSITKLGALEFAIAAGQGGKGSVWIDDLELKALPPVKPYTGKTVGTASSRMCELHDPSNLFDEDPKTAWECEPKEAAPWYQIDFGESREFGGLSIQWERSYSPAQLKVSLSDDAKAWTAAAMRTGLNEARSFIQLPSAQARYVRLDFIPRPNVTAVGMQTLRIEDTAFGDTPNNLFRSIAASGAYPKGAFPRYWSNEQTYWTVIGVPGDAKEALINEEGQVEVEKQGFMIDPMVARQDGESRRVQTWVEGTHTQELVDGFLPMPMVIRKLDEMELKVTALVDGSAKETALNVCYELHNAGNKHATGELILAIRPFQVLPPWQELNIVGGVGRIATLAQSDDDVIVNGEHRLILHTKPTAVRFATFDAAPCLPLEEPTRATEATETTDPNGLASGVIRYAYSIKPNASRRWWIAVPLHTKDRLSRLNMTGKDSDNTLRAVASNVADNWLKILVRTKFELPDEAKGMLNTWYATPAYIMNNLDGNAFQPGSRTYERSWMRDGCMTSAAMLNAGFPEVAKLFINWYATFQTDYGKIPAVVDRRGADPTDEHDSTGQYIWAVMNYYRFTHDQEFLKLHYPRIRKAMDYIQYLRALRMTPEYADKDSGKTVQEPGKPAVPMHAFFGLVPQSISHEGYSAKPMHSYWDDFFTLRGIKDAVEAARYNGDSQQADVWAKLRDDFAQTLTASIAAAQTAHGVKYIPGCVELGDFDATSTTIALWPAQIENILPAAGLKFTFDRYWTEFVKRRDDPSAAWEAFTPYELRHVGALIRLGARNHALDVMRWHMTMQRPKAWNQWQEVVWRDERAPKFIGDSPHTWCASDFMNSFRSMFVYERESDSSLVLLAGIPESWPGNKNGVAFQDMPTQYGKISCHVRRDGAKFTITVAGDITMPAGGLVIKPPSDRAIRKVTCNGAVPQMSPSGDVVVREVPAKVEIFMY